MSSTERELFISVLEVESPIARRSLLKRLCPEDHALRTRVETLLETHERGSQFLVMPAIEQLMPSTTGAMGPLFGKLTRLEETASDSQTGGTDAEFGDTRILEYLESSTRADSLGRLAHYDLLEIVGQGAFGTVFKALDEKLQRTVAIKMLSVDYAATSPARKRFLREARMAAAIRHENVVAIYAVEESPIPYIVMEYVSGLTLQQHLLQTGPLDFVDVLRLGKQIADGLAAAHAQQVIHRDVKPSNILLGHKAEARAKLTDFGLARTSDDASITHSGLIAGTPLYMAPEQVLGHRLDHRADLFSFGSVLYEMLRGRPPFRAPTMHAVMKRVAEETPRALDEVIPETPTWMIAIVSKLHAKDPADRYGSATEVSELLARCLTDLEQGCVPRLPTASASNSSRFSAMPSRLTRLYSGVGNQCVSIAAGLLLTLIIGVGVSDATGVTQLVSTVVRLTTGAGTLVLETDDPNTKVLIDGEEVVVRGAGIAELTLRPGQHQVAVMKDGVLAKRELVSIERNGRSVLQVRLEPDDRRSHSETPAATEVRSPSTLASNVAVEGVVGMLLSADCEWSEPINLGTEINSESEDSQTTLSADGCRMMFFSRRNGTHGIYECRRDSIDQSFGAPVRVPPEDLNDSRFQFSPGLSSDGLSMVFSCRDKQLDLFISHRESRDEPWQRAKELNSELKLERNAMHASFSPSGLTLAFSSSRPVGKAGAMDIWIAHRRSLNSPWTPAKALGNAINTDRFEGHPQLLDDNQTLLFVRSYDVGHSGHPLMRQYLAQRNNQGEIEVQHLNSPVSHSFFLLPDGKSMYFSRCGPPGRGAPQGLWLTQRVPKRTVAEGDKVKL
ncbi:Serine/threonine-protein kinase PrkC [Rosistilla carotiformis]|uniref:Serine/threonine-protein kinase PrkC n=1 Tax=Rosistilla carotiformis TaxID=2528017 RepID=A0A518JPR7_9BACT|nr:serine/threonine-protein kinase [Rosistilla carotiformis]QDV67542.1 Serine/threonine-protein kinase PrkC [Rosistilla carotiformis]